MTKSPAGASKIEIKAELTIDGKAQETRVSSIFNPEIGQAKSPSVSAETILGNRSLGDTQSAKIASNTQQDSALHDVSMAATNLFSHSSPNKPSPRDAQKFQNGVNTQNVVEDGAVISASFVTVQKKSAQATGFKSESSPKSPFGISRLEARAEGKEKE